MSKRMQWKSVFRAVVLLALLALAPGSARAQCFEWSDAFAGLGMNDRVDALCTYDDGTGPALYAVGEFVTAGTAVATRIARWDGSSWSALGEGISGSIADVKAMTVFDDGSGPALYVTGNFDTAGGVPASGLARWDGTSWSSPGGLSGASGYALEVFDDGTGPALYVGGFFSTAGGVPANRLARWDGATWSEVGGGTDGEVLALHVWDDGSGEALYVAGDYDLAGGNLVRNIARWDGTSWSDLDGGSNFEIASLTDHDDGNGSQLYAGGRFTSIGPLSTRGVASWDGTAWSALGGGITSSIQVSALTTFDDGGGADLYVGGLIEVVDGGLANNLVRWDGVNWSTVGPDPVGTDATVLALHVHDDGSGAALYAAGLFESAGTTGAHRIVRWDGRDWSTVGGGQGVSSRVDVLAAFDEGDGPVVFAGGDFLSAGEQVIQGLARWDGSVWSEVGGGVDDSVSALATWDDGTGEALYVAGRFDEAGPLTNVNGIARWDGVEWSRLGTGLSGTARDMVVFDDGTGEQLYVTGQFFNAGGVSAQFLARWDGTSWSALTGGDLNGVPQALAVYDDGTGPALYVGGSFLFADGQLVNRVARWDGVGWSDLDGGVTGGNTVVSALADHDGLLYVGGVFDFAGAEPASRIASWDGTNWSDVGGGMTEFLDGVVAFATFDDGFTQQLVVGGRFSAAGGVPAEDIARWDGQQWSALGAGIDLSSTPSAGGDAVLTLLPFPSAGGSPATLFAGGDFLAAGGAGASGMAAWVPRSVDLFFTDYGQGLAGSGGFVPRLSGGACPAGGSQLPVRVNQALGGAAGWLAVGRLQAASPFAGGVLNVDGIVALVPHVLLGAPGVAGVGRGEIVLPIPAGVPSGAEAYLQAAYLDGAAPEGLSLSAGLAVVLQGP